MCVGGGGGGPLAPMTERAGMRVRPYQFDVSFLGQTGAGNRPGWSA